ncbi:metal ABC transporter permease [Bacillus sp. HMF5848]|uniref:metal ABC transporter permease n=1 Tax=Bacillus sp. HMF5848 TaxID=2495421 RepID=UPI000F777FCA|nr:metal ABC transporter permease [Bacillus sp. HMF5848]RSK28272.1 metal ABC transporter permease [Bacillus sp. HMF5848]
MGYDAWIILTGSLVGAACGLVSCFLILRRMAMLADAISHSVILGIIGAYLVSQNLQGVSMLIGAVIVGMLTAFLVQFLNSLGVQADASIGVVFTFLFAVGVILISVFAGQVHIDTQHALMGEIAFIPWNTLEIAGMNLGPIAVWMLSVVLIINIILIALFYKEIKISSFDPEMALALGIPITVIHYLLMGMLSITTVASFDSVGAILVVAMLIVPGATAYLLTDRLFVMLILSIAVGVAAAILGYWFASIFNVSISGSMAMMGGVLFTLALFFSPTHGLIAKYIARRKIRYREITRGS